MSEASVGSVATTGSGPSCVTDGRCAAIVASWAAVSEGLSKGSIATETAGAGFGAGLERSAGVWKPSSAAVKPSTTTQYAAGYDAVPGSWTATSSEPNVLL